MSTEPFAKGVISPYSITYLSEFNCSQKRTHYDSKEYKHKSPALGKADARKSTLFFLITFIWLQHFYWQYLHLHRGKIKTTYKRIKIKEKYNVTAFTTN